MPFRFNSKRLMAIPTHHHPYRLRSTVPPGTRIAVVRSYSRSSIHQYPTKDAQDRNSLNPQSTQYSQSGGGDAAAASEKTAFDPRQTAPETQEKSAASESGEVRSDKGSPNPLNVSPANQGVNQPRDSQEGGAESSSGESPHGKSDRQRTSGGGSAPKSGGGKYGGS